jgi:hypothetical protein
VSQVRVSRQLGMIANIIAIYMMDDDIMQTLSFHITYMCVLTMFPLFHILCCGRATRVAVARALLCQQAHDTNRSVLSFDTGISGTSERALAIFFQNLFCSLLDVRIVYPFSTLPRLNELHSMPWKKR